MKKMFKSKKGLVITVPALILIMLITGGLTFAGISYFGKTKDLAKEDYMDIKPPEAPKNVDKICTTEDGSCESGKTITNNAQVFMRTCQTLHKAINSDPYFISGGTCISCKDYYGNDGNLPTISLIWFPSKTECEKNLFVPTPPCLNIKTKEDCKTLKTHPQAICDITKYEKLCVEEPDEDCPDVKIGGVIPFPDLTCKVKKFFKELFLPFKIISMIVGAIIMWLLTIVILHNIKFKLKKAIIPIGVIFGLLFATLIWFYFEWAIVIIVPIVIITIITKTFIFKKLK